MRNRVVLALLIAFMMTGIAVAQDTETDLARLIGELGAHADESIVRDLADPNLLPASGVHKPQFIWNVSRVSPRGALALIVPPAVRVGRTLLDLRAMGIEFTDSFTVRRILNATEMWDKFRASPAYSSAWKAATESVDRRDVRAGERVRMTDARATSGVSELTGPVTNSLPPSGPQPGELYCCLLFNVYSIEGPEGPVGFMCADDGNMCEICARCGSGQPPVWPGPMRPTEIQPR